MSPACHSPHMQARPGVHAQALPSGASKWIFADSREPETMLPLSMMSVKGVQGRTESVFGDFDGKHRTQVGGGSV